MSDPIEASLSRALLAHRTALRGARASAALDARFEQSLGTWRARRVEAGRRRRMSWALAAAMAGVLIAATAWLVLHAGTLPARASADTSSSGQPQVAAADAAVLRVRASLGAQLPVRNGNGFSSRRRHYWVDVSVAPDGTLNIERVTPIDEDPQLFVP
jgi:hypothetical protein